MDESLVILREAKCLIKIIYTQRDHEKKIEKYMKAHSTVRNEDKDTAGLLQQSSQQHLLSDGQGMLMLSFFRLLICMHTINDIYVV